tara:strand:+ start:302 stop:625 length:324 start_codon:yes stop_codon:yes gene_type:complete
MKAKNIVFKKVAISTAAIAWIVGIVLSVLASSCSTNYKYAEIAPTKYNSPMYFDLFDVLIANEDMSEWTREDIKQGKIDPAVGNWLLNQLDDQNRALVSVLVSMEEK